ncbi:restriction endonuclease subunit S [Morganella morganii]|uniref:restriction endonuclease subunit S n=1 Tax=Morganella morganii TaxID=582 RepID=UPI00046B07CA|nr:restriction endonuclease subunit S [Morganella morganii]
MLPEGWESKKLGSISSLVTSGSRDWAQFYSDTGSKFIRMTNLRRDSIYLKMDDLKFVDVNSDSADGKRTSLQTGDILISITAELGKIGWIHFGLGQAFINQHTALVRVKPKDAESKFIAYLLCSGAYHRRINSLNDAGAKAGLNLATIRTLDITLPLLHEQKKIAQILSTWDNAISATERLLDNSQQRKKAVMQQLLTGKKRLPGFEGEWRKLKLKDCATCHDNKRKPLNSEERSQMKGTIPYWGANGIVDYVSEYIFDGEFVLLAEDGGNFSEYQTRPIANILRGKAWVNNHAHILSGKKDCTNAWLYYSLVHKNILGFVNGGTRAKLNKSDMLLIPINLPSIKEQQAIANILTTADQEIDAQQKRLDHLWLEKKALMQQLLTGKRRVIADADAA